mmetsp:Transcript_10334/g.14589  ORF Transcript_10334/g.14589 Transcript_10334/m.14589 type:complete len:325 (+) Transcript_10334:134-1108(+)
MATIPTLRLDNPDKQNTVDSLRSACTDVGFFYLEGHGISDEILHDVMQACRIVFDLPLSSKQSLSDKNMSRGYTAFEEETLDPGKQTRGDTKEGFYFARDIPKSSPKYNPAKLAGPNVWPSPALCPEMTDTACDAFRDSIMTYFEKASELGFRIVQMLALAIGLDDERYFDKDFTEPMAAMRPLHYASEKSNPEKGVFACGAHSDYGMITLLLTDENPGLQILTKQGEWVDVPPKPGSFVVNLGDMLERWTNGLFRSTVHRVLTSGENDRYSIPFFYEPNFDSKVECLPICCSPDNPAKYTPTTSGEHLLEKYRQTHADFSPED